MSSHSASNSFTVFLLGAHDERLLSALGSDDWRSEEALGVALPMEPGDWTYLGCGEGDREGLLCGAFNGKEGEEGLLKSLRGPLPFEGKPRLCSLAPPLLKLLIG